MGFLRALFDIRFREMITGKIIVFLYVIAMIAIGLAYIGAVVNGFNNGVGTGLLVLLIIGPIGSLFALAYIRVILEVFIVLFRIYENTQTMASLTSASDRDGPLTRPSATPAFGYPAPSVSGRQGSDGDPAAQV